MDTPTTNGAPAGPRPSGIDVALATARVRLAETHFQQAIAFIEFTADELSTPRALGIYARLHYLTEIEYATIRNRVLASFGESGPGPAPATSVTVDDAVAWDVTASVFHRLRRRLGGRRNLRLRRRVELFSGRVEAALLDIHVECVCRMVKHVDAATSVAEVVGMYMEALGVQRTAYPTIYVGALARLYTELEAAEAVASAPATEPETVTSKAEAPQPTDAAIAAETDAGGQGEFAPGSGMPDLDLSPSSDRGRLRVVPGRAF